MKNLHKAAPLFAVKRDFAEEIIVHGLACFKDSRSEFFEEHASTYLTARSLLKPWQAMAAAVLDEKPSWTMGFSSHSGESEHIEQIRQLALSEDIALDSDGLICPVSYPLDEEQAWQLRLSGGDKKRIFHPCIGKHLMMLSACRQHGWQENYWAQDHPLHERVDKIVRRFTAADHDWLTDSCGVPTLYCRVETLMNMWQELAVTTDNNATVLKRLWTQHPHLVGGRNRLDTALIQVGRGYVLAKEGADGLLAVQSLPSEHNDAVQGCFVKLASGYNAQYLGLALWGLLSAKKDQLNSVMLGVLDYLEQQRSKWVASDQEVENRWNLS